MIRLYRDADVYDRCGGDISQTNKYNYTSKSDFNNVSLHYSAEKSSGLQDLQHNRERFKPLQFFDTSRPRDLRESFSASAFKIQVEAIIRKHSQGGVVFFDKIGEEIYKLYNNESNSNI